jgi:glycosyltransferase involved in cell wall biosynthesis
LNPIPSNQDGISQRSSAVARDEILFVTDRRFWRRSIGSEQRIATLILHLARRGEHVAVVYVGRVNSRDRALLTRFLSSAPKLEGLTRPFDWKTLWHASRKWLRRPRIPGSKPEPFPGASRWASAIESNDAPDDALDRPDQYSPARRAFVQSVIQERRPRIVIVEFSRLTYTVFPRGAAAGNCRYWVDTHDILHKRAERYRTAGATVTHPILASQEARDLETYDAILAIQKQEGDQLRELVPHRPVIVVPHGIDLPILPERTSDARQPTRLGFLGGRDESNRHALDWFVDRIWPNIRSRFGEKVELHVAGQICHAWQPRGDGIGIVIVGPIDSIEHFWPSIDIAINPVRFGSGLKIKNVEALAYGCPLITTSIGAEGLEVASPDGLRIADTECKWDRSLDDWLTNPDSATELGQAARAYAQAHLTEDAAFHALELQIAETLSETIP